MASYDDAIEKLAYNRLNLIRSYFDWFGIDTGWNYPEIEYRNYLAENLPQVKLIEEIMMMRHIHISLLKWKVC